MGFIEYNGEEIDLVKRLVDARTQPDGSVILEILPSDGKGENLKITVTWEEANKHILYLANLPDETKPS